MDKKNKQPEPVQEEVEETTEEIETDEDIEDSEEEELQRQETVTANHLEKMTALKSKIT